MTVNLDLTRLLEVAKATGALSGNYPGSAPMPGLMSKEASLTLSTMGSMYGCCGLFTACGDNDLLSLSVEDEPFLDWLGWQANNECNQFVKLITYIWPSGTAAGSASAGTAGACDDPNGVEFGTCEILLPDKGRLKRAGPVRDLTENNRKVCDEYPVFTKDGQKINDELMWSLTLAGVTVKQDLKRMIVTGNAATTNQFSGLETLVNTGYVNAHNGQYCTSMDSQVINWANQPMSYQPNGTHNFVDYLIDTVRRIRQRAAWANMGGISLGDQVIMLPTYLRDCLLDSFTCWSVCKDSDLDQLATLEARTFRNSLNGGTYGMGQITVDGVPVPIVTYDWQAMTQTAPYHVGDIYVLTKKIGNVPVLWGQYIDMSQPAAAFQEQAGYAHYKALDGGKFLAYWKTDNECTQAVLTFRPNLYCSAPWAQARIYDVGCDRPLNPISPDPTATYYAEEYLDTAVCPEDYLVTLEDVAQ